MRHLIAGSIVALVTLTAAAQQPPLPATDITAAQIQAFIDKLPKDAISDLPIRVVDVGGYRVGVFGVFRPKSAKQDAILHEVRTTEVYYMLEGAGTLVTGGRLVEERREGQSTSVRGSRIEGGVSRRIAKGDVVVIPAGTPHWWSAVEAPEIYYIVVRVDPERVVALK